VAPRGQSSMARDTQRARGGSERVQGGVSNPRFLPDPVDWGCPPTTTRRRAFWLLLDLMRDRSRCTRHVLTRLNQCRLARVAQPLIIFKFSSPCGQGAPMSLSAVAREGSAPAAMGGHAIPVF
jgi:hypothetical protein